MRFNPDLEVFVSKQRIEKYEFHLIEIDDDYVEGLIALLLEKDTEIGLKPKKDWWWGDLKRTELKDCFFMSNKGIFVGNIDILPEYFNPWKVVIDLNLKRNELDLNAPRNDVVQNAKFDKFMSNMESMLINGFGDFLSVLEQKCRKVNVDHKELFNDFFGEFIVGWKMNEFIKKNKLSDKLLNFIKKFYYFKYISKEGVSYMAYDEITRSSKPIRILRSYKYGEECIKQIFSGCSIVVEGELYLLSEGYTSDAVIECLFDDINPITLTSFLVSFLGMKESDELKDMIQKTWKLARFQNYETSRLIECSYLSSYSHSTTILNRDHKFINLLVESKHIVRDGKKMAVQGFFKDLRKDLKVTSF